MMDLHTVPLFLILPISFVGGFVLGVVYFRSVRTTANLAVSGDRLLLGLMLTLGRFFLLAAGLYLAVQAGGLALLAAFAGVLAAKAVMLRKLRREPR